MEPTVIVLIVVVIVLVVALAAAGVVLSRRRRSARLQDHYGPEYDRALADTGDPRQAEAELTERERRVRSLDIRNLDQDESARFEESWADIQRGFVDDPVASLHRADDLVVEIMRTRGYPVDDFEQRAADVSVEHPDVVQHYREARAVRDETEHGGVDTERQRHAVTSYRALIEALLGRRDTDLRSTDRRGTDDRDADRSRSTDGYDSDDDGRHRADQRHTDQRSTDAHDDGRHADQRDTRHHSSDNHVNGRTATRTTPEETR